MTLFVQYIVLIALGILLAQFGVRLAKQNERILDAFDELEVAKVNVPREIRRRVYHDVITGVIYMFSGSILALYAIGSYL